MHSEALEALMALENDGSLLGLPALNYLSLANDRATYTASHEEVLRWGATLHERRVAVDATSGEFAITGSYLGLPITFRTPNFWPEDDRSPADVQGSPLDIPGETPVSLIHALQEVTPLNVVPIQEAQSWRPSPRPRSSGAADPNTAPRSPMHSSAS